MDVLIQVIIATFLISLISLSGAVLFVFRENVVNKYMILFVALAAGSLLGTAFFHLIPEAVELDAEHEEVHVQDFPEEEHNHVFLPSYFMLLGILLFYVIEKFVHWHHHHDIDCHKHALSTLSIVGDAFHNFIDGALIAAAFYVDISLGIVTTVAIALHEIPQEIGDLAILLHGGMSKFNALLWNFISALFAVAGAIAMFFFVELVESAIPVLVAFVAGTFIYISLADIIPELKKKHDFSQITISLVFFVGIALSFVMSFVGH